MFYTFYFFVLFFFTSITFWFNDWLISDLCSVPLVVLQNLTSFGFSCLNTCRWPAIAALSEPACSSILHFCSKTWEANVFFCIFFVVVCLFRDARWCCDSNLLCVTFCQSLFSISVAGDLQLPNKKHLILSRSAFYTLHRDNTKFFLSISNPWTIPLKKKFHANESLMAEILFAKRHLQITYDQ